MNIRFLCVFIFLMCAFTAGIVNAHTLHVGNKTIALSQTKYTTPSLAFGIGNEVWYAPMTTTDLLITTLRINTNNQNYSLCEPPEFQNVPENCNCVFTDMENYTYDNDGRLIGADERLWIKAGGGNFTSNYSPNAGYIDTGFTADSDTRIKTKVYIEDPNKDFWFFLTRTNSVSNSYGAHYHNNGYFRNTYGTITNNFYYSGRMRGIYIADKNKNSLNIEHPNGEIYTNSIPYRMFTTPHTMLILTQFAADVSYQTHQIASNYLNKQYYFKIWDDGVLVRDMVPVPACMRIGDFVVPENGMWDIVEQKFYGNANTTGTIIYGKDE